MIGTRLVLFIDDGGVMNDNAVRAPQWQRLLGEFFSPILGSAPDAWATANRDIAPRLWAEYDETMRGRVDVAYPDYERAYSLAWLRGMCEHVGVPAPASDDACCDLARRAAAYVTPRIQSALPGAVEAIRCLHARGYRLHTASGEQSYDLEGYLRGMQVRDCFGRLYGPDLVNTLKEGPEFYSRIFADAGVAPADALVVDDSPRAVAWAAQAGAVAALVGPAPDGDVRPALVIKRLAELPQTLPRLAERGTTVGQRGELLSPSVPLRGSRLGR